MRMSFPRRRESSLADWDLYFLKPAASSLKPFFHRRAAEGAEHKSKGKKAKNLLNKYGFYIIFFTRFFLVNLCAVVSYVSGLEKVSRKKFIFAVISGEFLFAIIYPLIGFTLGEIFSSLINAINYFIVAVLLLILVFYLIRPLFKFYFNK